jgi:hypothetical protein
VNGNGPAITSFSPLNGILANPITIKGTTFLSVASVKFNGTNAVFRVDSTSQITAFVPSGATSGPITVTTANGTATTVDHFFVGTPGIAPAISSFSPLNGSIGVGVTINGTNFTGVTAVKFNGTNASFTFNSGNRITAVVPFGASSGPISVMTPNGTTMSLDHFFFGVVGSSCAISSFSPTSGHIGSTVVINGTNFTPGATVRFNGTNASFVFNSGNRLTATLPSGATTGSISVTTPNNTATSTGIFTVN